MGVKSKVRLTGRIIIRLVLSIILMVILTGIFSIPAIIYIIVNSNIPLELITNQTLNDPVAELLSAVAAFLGVLLTVLIMTKFKILAMKNMGWTDFCRRKSELIFGLILGFASITVVS
ncbi:MAG: hypothetical protein ACO1OT_12095 [Heyndrickxia sp.]